MTSAFPPRYINFLSAMQSFCNYCKLITIYDPPYVQLGYAMGVDSLYNIIDINHMQSVKRISLFDFFIRSSRPRLRGHTTEYRRG